MGALRFLPLTAAKLVDFIIRHQTKKAAFFSQRYSAKKQLRALSRTAHWPPSLALLHLHSSYLSGLTVCLEIAPPRPAAALPRLRSHARTCHCFRSYGPDHCPSKNPPDPAYLCVNSSHSSHGQSLFQLARSINVAAAFVSHPYPPRLCVLHKLSRQPLSCACQPPKTRTFL